MSWALETWLTVVWVTGCCVSTQPNLSDTELPPAASKTFKTFPSASPSPPISLPLCICNSRLKALPPSCQTKRMGFEMLSGWTHYILNRCNTQRMEHIERVLLLRQGWNWTNFEALLCMSASARACIPMHTYCVPFYRWWLGTMTFSFGKCQSLMGRVKDS